MTLHRRDTTIFILTLLAGCGGGSGSGIGGGSGEPIVIEGYECDDTVFEHELLGTYKGSPGFRIDENHLGSAGYFACSWEVEMIITRASLCKYSIEFTPTLISYEFPTLSGGRPVEDGQYLCVTKKRFAHMWADFDKEFANNPPWPIAENISLPIGSALDVGAGRVGPLYFWGARVPMLSVNGDGTIDVLYSDDAEASFGSYKIYKQ
ncbi:MAG: hypothetical protein KDJ38_00150 [Gammaproteobacteria bacterium]|nr:hypothetical protein [Gammaproteobacteria bacterium]